jgi:predicted RNA binding protein YcfA (HicA-like mRNA interferase family)
MKVRDIMTRIEKDGSAMLHGTGSSHRQYKHPRKPVRVTIAGHRNDVVDPGTLKSILRQAGLK